jgi:hypothetical protein
MYAVEFEAHIENDLVHIPPEYKKLNNHEVQVFIIPISKKKQEKKFNPHEYFGVGDFSKKEIDDFIHSSRMEWESRINEE